MPAASTYKLSVQVSDFEDNCLLIQLARLVCDFCSSSQRFACGFLQIPPRDGHPCRPANSSPCRACRRLSLPSECALPGAQLKRRHAWRTVSCRSSTCCKGYHMPRLTSILSPACNSGSGALPSRIAWRLCSSVTRKPLGLRRAIFALLLTSGGTPADIKAWVKV